MSILVSGVLSGILLGSVHSCEGGNWNAALLSAFAEERIKTETEPLKDVRRPRQMATRRPGI